MSSFANIARPGSGARLNKKQYAEWLRRYRRHDKLEAALKRIANCETQVPGLAPEFYGHAKAIAIEDLKAEYNRTVRVLEETQNDQAHPTAAEKGH